MDNFTLKFVTKRFCINFVYVALEPVNKQTVGQHPVKHILLTHPAQNYNHVMFIKSLNIFWSCDYVLFKMKKISIINLNIELLYTTVQIQK